MVIVSNAGPLLSFARANHLEFLEQVVEKLTIPDAVYEEVVTHGAGKPGALEVEKAAWIKRQSAKDQSFVDQLPQQLHWGEREAIALAKELNGVLLIDDYEARKEARRRGIEVFGSLRILKEAKKQGIIQAVKPILDELIAAGSYISDDLYQVFLREVGENPSSGGNQ